MIFDPKTLEVWLTNAFPSGYDLTQARSSNIINTQFLNKCNYSFYTTLGPMGAHN
jgi:hypothetical protein